MLQGFMYPLGPDLLQFGASPQMAIVEVIGSFVDS